MVYVQKLIIVFYKWLLFLCVVDAVPDPGHLLVSSVVMTSSVSCLDVCDSLTLSTAEEVLNSSMTSVTAALAHSQVTVVPML